MLDELIYLLLTVVITFALYPLWIDFVYKYHMGEDIRKDGPETHKKKRGTPTMGGLVFILTVAVITLIFNRSRTQTLFPIFVAGLAGLFGMMEDFTKVYKKSALPHVLKGNQRTSLLRRIPLINLIFLPWDLFKKIVNTFGSSPGTGLDSVTKLFFQLVLSGFVSYWTYFKLGWDYIWFPLIGDVHIGFFYFIFIFILFLVVLNTVAFTDGLDGLAGGLAMIAFGVYWVMAFLLGYYSLGILAATFMGALLPFLYFNIHPARIFMGDVGSHVLGAALAMFAIVMHREIAMVFILGVFLVDGISSPLQQISVKFTGKRLFRMAPLHHHFELMGWPETKVTERFWLFGILIAFFGLLVALL
jgi:phospho-N-acetylmuramoyl-pentapeptide-transferase